MIKIISIFKNHIPYCIMTISNFPFSFANIYVFSYYYLGGKPGSFYHLSLFFKLVLFEREKRQRHIHAPTDVMSEYNWPHLVYVKSSV